MRTEDVLSAIATGLWRWDNASGTVCLDAEAARLLGLPAEPVVLTLAATRARFHPVDWNEINSIVHLAIAERTLAETRLRVMDENGRALRTVRARARTSVRREPDAPAYVELYGTIQEVAEVRPGTTVEGARVTGDWRRSREAFLLDAGRALAEARSTAEVLRVAASLSMPGFSPDGLAVFGVSGDRLTIIGHHGHSPGDEVPFSEMTVGTDYPAAEVVRTGRAIYLSAPDAYQSRYPTAWQYVRHFERQSWAYLPLVVSGRTLGCWMAGFKHRVSFSPDERSVLTTVARMLAQALARAGLAETERELSLGLQRTMMPTVGPRIPGMTVAARYVPTGGGLQVGGDWYDMIPLPGGTTKPEAGGRGRGRGGRERGGGGGGGRAGQAGGAEGRAEGQAEGRAGGRAEGRRRGAGGQGSGQCFGVHSGGRGADGFRSPGEWNGGRFALVIGDVQGHDVRAAGLMGQLRVALRAYASEGHRPDAVLSRASRFLAGLQHCPRADGTGGSGGGEAGSGRGCGGGGGGGAAGPEPDECALNHQRFATCLYLEVDPEAGTLDIARAGHPDPVIRTADGTAVVRQTAGGLPLGIEADSDYPTTRLDLEPGETLMLCTDGLIETGGHDLATGWARLRPVLEQNSGESLEKLADALIQAVHGPTSHYTTGPLADRREDDIALLLLSRDRELTGRTPRTTRRSALTVAQAEPERVAGARRQVRDLLHDWADGEQIDSAELMVSEMLTNVLVHTDNDALLIAEAVGEHGSRRLRVEVADVSDDLPHRRRPGELASSGRGLVLMEMLADAWGVDPRGEGKSIWFELYECEDEDEDEAPEPEAPATARP